MHTDARRLLLNEFAWVDGHADVWRVFRDPTALKAMVTALADPFRDTGITAVAGIESRGFLLGAAVAIELGVGFVAVRKAGALFPGPKVSQRTAPDYRGNQSELLIQRASLNAGDRVLLVDDWVETGSQARAVQTLAEACEAKLVGLSVLVDGTAGPSELPQTHAVVQFAELPRPY